MTVDTHMPFHGFDDEDQYDDFVVGAGMNGDESEAGRTDRYFTVLKYSDHYVRSVVENISAQDNNTIFVILGDHGAREVNIMKDRPEEDAFGDELFKTTAILYSPTLGHQYFPHEVDSEDIAHTLFSLLDDQPSARFGSNLLSLEHNPRVQLHFTNILSELVVNQTRSRVNTFNASDDFNQVRNFYRHLHYANGYFHKGFYCTENCQFPMRDQFVADNQAVSEVLMVLGLATAGGLIYEALRKLV